MLCAAYVRAAHVRAAHVRALHVRYTQLTHTILKRLSCNEIQVSDELIQQYKIQNIDFITHGGTRLTYLTDSNNSVLLSHFPLFKQLFATDRPGIYIVVELIRIIRCLCLR